MHVTILSISPLLCITFQSFLHINVLHTIFYCSFVLPPFSLSIQPRNLHHKFPFPLSKRTCSHTPLFLQYLWYYLSHFIQTCFIVFSTVFPFVCYLLFTFILRRSGTITVLFSSLLYFSFCSPSLCNFVPFT